MSYPIVGVDVEIISPSAAPDHTDRWGASMKITPDPTDDDQVVRVDLDQYPEDETHVIELSELGPDVNRITFNSPPPGSDPED